MLLGFIFHAGYPSLWVMLSAFASSKTLRTVLVILTRLLITLERCEQTMVQLSLSVCTDARLFEVSVRSPSTVSCTLLYTPAGIACRARMMRDANSAGMMSSLSVLSMCHCIEVSVT